MIFIDDIDVHLPLIYWPHNSLSARSVHGSGRRKGGGGGGGGGGGDPDRQTHTQTHTHARTDARTHGHVGGSLSTCCCRLGPAPTSFQPFSLLISSVIFINIFLFLLHSLISRIFYYFFLLFAAFLSRSCFSCSFLFFFPLSFFFGALEDFEFSFLIFSCFVFFSFWRMKTPTERAGKRALLWLAAQSSLYMAKESSFSSLNITVKNR